ncbi:hypothetical protein HELRODRAFT_77327, partial [Helobdella robusta]|uniref:Fibrinogen C-terminal domain-containing protein n=1 Tax=Helobdella robusta TaxID=6412 RepID=T1G2W2_HELRO
VIQRRMDGSENFYRNWSDYQHGFGDTCGEFWIGRNDNLYRLTSTSKYQLLIVLEDFDGNLACAVYDSFSVGPPSSDYTLKIGNYRGTAGDSLKYHNNMVFSTYDHDFKRVTCPALYKGAWWYNSCHESNLNGRYLHGNHTTYADGVNWLAFRGHHYSLKFTEMRAEMI